MEQTEDSERSAEFKRTQGIYPKEHIQYSKPDEILKSRSFQMFHHHHHHHSVACLPCNFQLLSLLSCAYGWTLISFIWKNLIPCISRLWMTREHIWLMRVNQTCQTNIKMVRIMALCCCFQNAPHSVVEQTNESCALSGSLGLTFMNLASYI